MQSSLNNAWMAAWLVGSAASVYPGLTAATDDATTPLPEVKVVAPEPRYVAPTLRDRIGRIWAPVFINDQGPYRLVLDSGASRSCIIASVATSLGLLPDQADEVMLRGVTGSAAVPVVHVNSVVVGDLSVGATELPVLADALGGADGVLGLDGMMMRRISVDFLHDRITILRSHAEPAAAGFLTIPFTMLHGHLPAIDARMGGIKFKVIIDTGGQVTIGNLALRDAMMRSRHAEHERAEEITGVTDDVQAAKSDETPAIRIASQEGHEAITIRTDRVVFGDLRLFEQWNLTREPVMLLGMDALGTLSQMIIDFRRQELQLRMREP